MAIRPPSDEALQAAAARRRRREGEERQRQDRRRNRLRWAVWVFALLLAAALLADLTNMTRRVGDFRRTGKTGPHAGDAADIVRGLDDPPYVDPSGLFRVVPPRHWIKLAQPPAGFFNVVFQGPFGMDMSVRATATNGLNFDRLVDRLQQIERGLSAKTHMDFAYVGPYRAVKRSVQLFRSRVLLLDFLTGDLSHHVQFSVPPPLYDEYEPVFLRLMQTYEPGTLMPVPASGAGP